MSNLILSTDSYKLTHFSQYPEGTTGVYSYLEARKGAEFDNTVFFGLLPLLKRLEGAVVTPKDVFDAYDLAKVHFGNPDIFNFDGWMYIARELQGKLPIRIKAVPEGTVVPVGNVLMTVENTDPKCFWLTNALESLLLHVWYPTTVASKSRAIKKFLAESLDATGGSREGLPFMLHDFGYRGATGEEAAAIGGLSHLVNFMGTDTLPALILGAQAYAADLSTLGFSIPATEHSVMTALGEEGEWLQVDRLLQANPTGIVSCVADSYNIYKFVDMICQPDYRLDIIARDGKFVIRPDSLTLEHQTPGTLMVDLMERLWTSYGGTTNDKGFRILDPHIGVIWGDGIDFDGIKKLMNRVVLAGFAAENLVFGMGGGLLQKVNRDTMRFAFKSSAQQRDGVWYDVQKRPLDMSKASKAGRLRLDRCLDGEYETKAENVAPHDHVAQVDLLQVVFEDGVLTEAASPRFEDVRKRAAL
jgi:nicotinamide phosphoribosyltransferase